MSDCVIEAVGLKKTYNIGGAEVDALVDVSLSINRGEIVAIMGPSGSGKSTLMNILGCLDRPTDGYYILDGEQVSDLNDNELARIRNLKVGFVFQSFNLLPRQSALSNVVLPMIYAGVKGNRTEIAKEALISVGLGDRMDHHPAQLSGGQQQRVAIARALINHPAIVMADEPTGNLDSHSGNEIMELLVSLNKNRGTTIILVTHDHDVAVCAHRTIKLRDGSIDHT